MKRFLILFILFSMASQAQEVKTQKDIIVIPNTDLVKDYNLKISNGNITPIRVIKGTYRDIGFATVSKRFQYPKEDYSFETLTFKDRKIIRKENVFHYGNKFIEPQKFGFSYTYNSKGILSKRESDKGEKGSFDVATYTFNTNGNIKKINEVGLLGNGTTYDKNKNFIKKGNSLFYTFENGTKTLEFKNGLITKITTFNKSANKNYVNTYTYDAKGNLSFEDRGASKSSYTLNDKNLIKKEITKTHTSHYKYLYDKYGNWIIAYQLAISEKNYSGEKVKPHLYGTSFSFYVREIKYSNGQVTGGKTPEHPNIKQALLKVRSELYNSLIESKVTYRRTATSSYLFNINGQQEARNTASGFMNRSLLVFHKPTKQLFICEGFGDKQEGKDFPAKKLSIDTKNGYWYRTPKGIIHVFKADGTYIEKFNVFKYATNDIDAILQENNDSRQLLLKNYRNSASYKVYSVKLHNSSVKSTVVKRKIQKELFSIPNTDLVEDYNLKIGKGNVIPKQIDEKQFDQRTKRGSKEIMTTLERTKAWYFDTENKRINSNSIIYRDQKTTIKYIYNTKGRLLMHNYKSPTFKYTDTFTYDDDGTFRYVRIYDGDSNSSRLTFKKTNYGYISSGLIFKKYYLKNNLIQRAIVNYNREEPSEDTYEYNNYNQLAKTESSFATMDYRYNSSGDMQTSVETSKNTNNVTTRNYIYVYDKYGNWIISLSLLNLSYAKGISSFPNPKLRKITYSNGEVTGTTDINKVKNELISLRKKVKNLETNTGNQVATWKKTTNGNFYFNLDNKAVQKAKLSYMGKDILAFIQDNNQLYIMKDAQNAATNTTFNAKKLVIETSYGYWFKKSNGGVTVFTNQGNAIQKSSLYKYAPNNMDVFYQGEGEPNKIVLKNYKNAKPLTVYPAINFDSYSNGNKIVTNTTAKRSGKCVKGDCDNGYGEFQFENGLKADGFFENGKPKGPMHLNNEAKNESRFTIYNGSYDAQIGMLYMYYKNRYTDIVDYKKQYGVTNDATEKRTYKLNFKNGKVVSKTEMTGNNSNSGCIIGNCTNGSGVYKYNNGAMYFGTFQNGKRHGFGKLDFKGGNLYIGEFQNGSYHGLGTYVWAEYNYYMGEYRNGKYHGKGVMYYNKETFEAGNWENGKMVGKINVVNKTNTSKNTTNTYNTNKNNIGFNSFSNAQKDRVLGCKNNTECISRYITSLYVEERKSISGKALIKKTTDYFHSLYTMNPKLAYDTLFKMDMSLIDLKLLPQAVQTDLKNRAKGLADGYKKFKQKNGN